MLKITKFAEKLNQFFTDRFEPHELHFNVTVQLNFSIDVSLYMSDTVSLTREKLKEEYLKWMTALSSNQGKSPADIQKECDEDLSIIFEKGDVKIYLNEFNDPGDPGEKRGPFRWGPRYRLSSLTNHTRKERNTDIPPVVTFYSYKGGMGRTTTMMGFALWLANKGKHVAIIDCDLEAPGYLNFFNLGEQKSFIDGHKNGFVEFVADCNFLKGEIKVADYTVIPTASNDNQVNGRIYDNIIIVPGGNLNDAFTTDYGEYDNESEFDQNHRQLADNNRKDYIEGLSRINLSNPSVLKQSFQTLIEKLKAEYNIDIVLIDSRTGFNDIYGSVAFDLADEVVAFFGFSRQTMPGLRQLLEVYKQNVELYDDIYFGLTLCNSILPSREQLSQNEVLSKKWNLYQKDFNEGVTNFTAKGGKEVESPEIYAIHRHASLEELGVSSDADTNFLRMIVDNQNDDYVNLFESIYQSLKRKGFMNEPDIQLSETDATENVDGYNIDAQQSNLDFESIRHMRPLQLTKIILRELRPKLNTVKNFAEHMDISSKKMFLYRDCMREIFNPNKFIVRGYKGAGKTCIYQALGNSDEVTTFIKQRARLDSDISYNFINVIGFEGISNHPLKLLEEDGAFSGQLFFNVNAFWQILTWNAIFSKNEYQTILYQSKLKGKTFTFKGSNGAVTLDAISEMIEGGASKVLAAIEDDFIHLDNFLEEKGHKLFIMYDGLDNVVKPKYWSKAISPLINKWGGNVKAYKNIHPKIFLRTDLFDRIEGTNVERLRDNIIDIDWDIAEVFGYLFKLILGENDCPSREAMWTIIRKLRKDTAERHINNMNRAITNGLGQFPRLDEQTLKPLVEIFFGREVNPKGAHLGEPWRYFEKQLSNAAGKISMRLFINTLTTDVLDKGLENSRTYVTEVISPDLYASREVRIKAAESYFNDMASEEDFTDDLQKVREFINSEIGKEYRKKALNESEFNEFMRVIIDTYKNNLHAVETPSELAQLIYASGLMKEIYKRGRKIYRFAPMYEYAWGLVGKSYEDDDEVQIAGLSPKINEGDILEGELIYGCKGRLTVKVGNRYYECESRSNIKIGSKVRFKVIKRPKVGSSGFFYMSSDLCSIE